MRKYSSIYRVHVVYSPLELVLYILEEVVDFIQLNYSLQRTRCFKYQTDWFYNIQIPESSCLSFYFIREHTDCLNNQLSYSELNG